MPTPFEDAAARLVARWQVASKHTTSYVLSLGQAAHVAIRAKLKGVQDPGARKTARADAIRALRAALEDAGCDRATELVRWVGCWAVGEVFGMEQAKLLSLATVRAFIPLVRRNAKTETWAARSTFRDFAKEVWSTAATMKAKEVTAAIRAKVGATRKPRTVKAPDPAAAMTKVVKSIEALPVEAQRQLLPPCSAVSSRRRLRCPRCPWKPSGNPSPRNTSPAASTKPSRRPPRTRRNTFHGSTPPPLPSVLRRSTKRRKRKQASSDHGAGRPVDADRRPDASLG